MPKINKKILLVGGGTGGHVAPLIAIIEELIKFGIPSNQIFLVTDKESSRMDFVQGHQIEIDTIISGKFNRFFTLSNILTPFKVILGFFQSFRLLKKIKPDVIFAKGAYLSAPLVYAAAKLKIPIYLHESDSIMGATNERLVKYAKKIFVSYPINYYNRDLGTKLIFSGLPIRKIFFTPPPRSFHLVGGNPQVGSFNLKSIFIWGGSQGAEKINLMISEKLKDYLKNFELYHICGEKNFEKYDALKRDLPQKLRNKYHLYGIVGREISKIISQADLVVSRAGSSLFELAAMAKAVIIIPYPAAASDHQTFNAEYFSKKNAAVISFEHEINSQGLKNLIFELMADEGRRRELEKNIYRLAPQGAAKKIVEVLLK